jgi:hypothetical protein
MTPGGKREEACRQQGEEVVDGGAQGERVVEGDTGGAQKRTCGLRLEREKERGRKGKRNGAQRFPKAGSEALVPKRKLANSRKPNVSAHAQLQSIEWPIEYPPPFPCAERKAQTLSCSRTQQ